MKRILAITVVLASLAVVSMASAQVNPAVEDVALDIEKVRAVLQAEHKLLVAENLGLSPQEAEKFWPVYDQYAAELDKAGDLRVKLITDYATAWPDISEDLARHLVDDMFRYQEKVLKVRHKYLGKFRKVLPEAKVARFYQIENKLDALVNIILANDIPLVLPAD